MTPVHRVLIADDLDRKAKDLLAAEGLEVTDSPAVSHQELVAGIARFEGLIVRSRSKVSADVLAAGGALRVVGRAGAGVDNIDVPEATRRGIVVMNAPGGNTLSTAEHTIAMMMALARNIAPADRSVKAMEWKRSKFTGTEISGKTLGIVGLGRVGQEVAARAAALGMTVVGYDPLVSDAGARAIGVEPLPLAGLYRRADFISVHTPLTPETSGLIDLAALRACKRGVRIINCARGGIVDEGDLLRALDEGIVAGAALDVFTEEPPRNERLVGHPAVVCTPHLGASTVEAQEKVALQVARQVADCLLGRGVSGSVNADAFAVALRDDAGPALRLAEKMGALVSQLGTGPVRSIRLSPPAGTSGDNARACLAALVAGFLTPKLAERVNLVNALALAAERGISAATVPAAVGPGRAPAFVAEFSTDSGQRTVAGALHAGDDPRIVMLDGYRIELKPAGWVLAYTNVDRPGMLARVSAVLAAASVNIGGLTLGRLRPGENALTVISIDTPVPDELLREIAKIEGISDVHLIHL